VLSDLASTPTRPFCLKCRKAQATCYCSLIRPFEAGVRFVILMHPREARNSIGTGRMLHRSVTDSVLIEGHDFTHDTRVNALIADPANHAAVLYPGRHSLNLSICTPAEASDFTPPGKRLTLFVIDGTWDLARGMINRSSNLKALPQIRFTPETASAYEIRQQPEAHCLSTLESVHWMIERFARLGIQGLPAEGAHHALVSVFRRMVKQQQDYEARSSGRTDGPRLRSPKPQEAP
jgi:DTW domain-containing protein YfiP